MLRKDKYRKTTVFRTGKKMKTNKFMLATVICSSMCLAACGSETAATTTETIVIEETATAETETKTPTQTETTSTETVVTTVSSNITSALDTSSMFTDRDLQQTADLSNAITYTVVDNEDIRITQEGVYVLTGNASEVTVYVDVADTDKVQLVLDNLTITNTDSPAIYVLNADKVFVTTASDSALTVTGTFVVDEENNLNAVIYSCDDLVLNGTGTLIIQSSDVGVKSKDDLKITGGTYQITSTATALRANDSIRIYDGTFIINAGTDGIHAEDDEDDTVGYVYIAGGNFVLNVGDDAIHGTTVVQIDDGTFEISAVEGIEGTYIQLNGGTFTIEASDDGINASHKSSSYSVLIEINGGDYTINMAQGDTDALDANGDIIINGGTLNITAQSAFDYDGTGTYNGGTLIVNGETVTQLTQMMMGGGGRGMGQGGMQGGGRPGEQNGQGPMGQPNENGGQMPSGDNSQMGRPS